MKAAFAKKLATMSMPGPVVVLLLLMQASPARSFRYDPEPESMSDNLPLRTTDVDTDACWLLPERGWGRAAFRRFRFDQLTGECVEFTYGGGGVDDTNNFPSEAACLSACGGRDPCSLPRMAVCEVVRPRFIYDQVTGECLDVVYEKCDEDYDESQCIDACSESEKDRCSLPPATGVGRAGFQRFYYDPATNDCLQFTFGGGWGGNANNFRSKSACVDACGK